MGGSSITDRYIRSFVDIARQQLRSHPWDEIEPALAASWEELREVDTPPWQEVATQILARCIEAGGNDRAA